MIDQFVRSSGTNAVIHHLDCLETRILKSYRYTHDLTINMVFENIRGVFAQVIAMNDQSEIPIRNIPQEIRFNPHALTKLLENAYLACQKNCDTGELCSISVLQRGLGGGLKKTFKRRVKKIGKAVGIGGGHKGSSTSHSTTTSSPPPPLPPITVTYTQGLTIRKVEILETSKPVGDLNRFVGAVNFQRDFQHEVVNGKPLVRIYVWRKDHYALQISQFVKEEITNLDFQQRFANKRIEIQDRISSLQSLKLSMEACNEKEAVIRTNNDSLMELEQKRVATLKTLLKIKTDCILEIEEKFHDLIKLIHQMQELNPSLIDSTDSEIEFFLDRDQRFDRLLSLDSPGNANALDDMLFNEEEDYESEWNKRDDLKKALLGLTRASTSSQSFPDLHVLLGSTGSGKSTCVNFLLGKKLEKYLSNGQYKIRVADGMEEIAKIGQRFGLSTTELCASYKRAWSPNVFTDTPGFFDTRGWLSDLAALASLKCTVDGAKKIKIILCVNAALVFSENGVHFRHLVNQTLDMIPNYVRYEQSILLMLTKPFVSEDGELITAAEICKTIKQQCENLEPGELKQRFTFLIRDEGRFITVCNPTESTSLDPMLEKLRYLNFIENPNNFFKLEASRETKSALNQLLSKHAKDVNRYIRSYQSAEQALLEVSEKLNSQQALRDTLLPTFQREWQTLHSMKTAMGVGDILQATRETEGLIQELSQLDNETRRLITRLHDLSQSIQQIDTTDLEIYESFGGSFLHKASST